MSEAQGVSSGPEKTTLAITRQVADHWRKAALSWGDTPMPGRLMAHPLCMVLDALHGNSARPEDFGVTPDSPEGLRIVELGFIEYGEKLRSGEYDA